MMSFGDQCRLSMRCHFASCMIQFWMIRGTETKGTSWTTLSMTNTYYLKKYLIQISLPFITDIQVSVSKLCIHSRAHNKQRPEPSLTSEGKVKKKCLMSFTAFVRLCNDSTSPSVQAALSLLLHLRQNPAVLSLLSFLTLKRQNCQTSSKGWKEREEKNQTLFTCEMLFLVAWFACISFIRTSKSGTIVWCFLPFEPWFVSTVYTVSVWSWRC